MKWRLSRSEKKEGGTGRLGYDRIPPVEHDAQVSCASEARLAAQLAARNRAALFVPRSFVPPPWERLWLQCRG